MPSIDLTKVLSKQIWLDIVANIYPYAGKNIFANNSFLQNEQLEYSQRRPFEGSKDLIELAKYPGTDKYIQQLYKEKQLQYSFLNLSQHIRWIFVENDLTELLGESPFEEIVIDTIEGEIYGDFDRDEIVYLGYRGKGNFIIGYSGTMNYTEYVEYYENDDRPAIPGTNEPGYLMFGFHIDLWEATDVDDFYDRFDMDALYETLDLSIGEFYTIPKIGTIIDVIERTAPGIVHIL